MKMCNKCFNEGMVVHSDNTKDYCDCNSGILLQSKESFKDFEVGETKSFKNIELGVKEN